MPQATAALLVVSGALLSAPHVLSATGEERGGAAPESITLPDDSAVGGRGKSKAPAQHSGIAGAREVPSGPAHGVLSPAMRDRLADADPVKALSALVGVRAMVLATGDAKLLSHVNVQNSEAMDADRKLVAGLHERGHVFNGLSIRLQEAAPAETVAVPEDCVAVRATAVMSGYSEMDSAGKAVRKVEESTPQDLVFVLVKEEGIWKITSVHTRDTV